MGGSGRAGKWEGKAQGGRGKKGRMCPRGLSSETEPGRLSVGGLALAFIRPFQVQT